MRVRRWARRDKGVEGTAHGHREADPDLRLVMVVVLLLLLASAVRVLIRRRLLQLLRLRSELALEGGEGLGEKVGGQKAVGRHDVGARRRGSPALHHPRGLNATLVDGVRRGEAVPGGQNRSYR
eukprot:SAG22_NODE_682_length_7924_cov_25.432460_5_plen_124_part_00